MARPLLAVQRQRIGGELFTPELLFKALPQVFRLNFQGSRSLRAAGNSAQTSRRQLRGINVSLHFTERDGRFRNRSVGMKNRIVRILPTLLHQPFGTMPPVFHKTVFVGISEFVDPA